MNTTYRTMAMELVNMERDRQIELIRTSTVPWDCANPNTGEHSRVAVLAEEFGEYAMAANERFKPHGSLDLCIQEAKQTAAVAVACMEAYLQIQAEEELVDDGLED